MIPDWLRSLLMWLIVIILVLLALLFNDDHMFWFALFFFGLTAAVLLVNNAWTYGQLQKLSIKFAGLKARITKRVPALPTPQPAIQPQPKATQGVKTMAKTQQPAAPAPTPFDTTLAVRARGTLYSMFAMAFTVLAVLHLAITLLLPLIPPAYLPAGYIIALAAFKLLFVSFGLYIVSNFIAGRWGELHRADKWTSRLGLFSFMAITIAYALSDLWDEWLDLAVPLTFVGAAIADLAIAKAEWFRSTLQRNFVDQLKAKNAELARKVAFFEANLPAARATLAPEAPGLLLKFFEMGVTELGPFVNQKVRVVVGDDGHFDFDVQTLTPALLVEAAANKVAEMARPAPVTVGSPGTELEFAL